MDLYWIGQNEHVYKNYFALLSVIYKLLNCKIAQRQRLKSDNLESLKYRFLPTVPWRQADSLYLLGNDKSTVVDPGQPSVGGFRVLWEFKGGRNSSWLSRRVGRIT